MQTGRSSHRDDLKVSVPHSRRALAAREALRRVTLELLQPQHVQQPYTTEEPCPLPGETSDDGDTAELAPAPGTDRSIVGQKTRLLDAIQPVLEVVADSALQHSDPHSVQL